MKKRILFVMLAYCQMVNLFAKVETPLTFVDEASPYIAEKSPYKLDPDRIYTIAKKLIESRLTTKEPREEFLNKLFLALQTEFAFLKRGPWTINNYYGVSGHMQPWHSSLTEYLIVYGSDINVLGQTGRYNMDIRTIILEGEHKTQWEESPFKVHSHFAGDRIYLPRGKQKIYSLNGWILECGQGQLWSAFPNVVWFNDFKNTRQQIGFAASHFLSHVKSSLSIFQNIFSD